MNGRVAIAVLCLLAPLPALAEESLPTAYVGNEPCRTCHPNIAVPFFRNAHLKARAPETAPAEKANCEACHGPARAHVEAKGGKATIIAFSQLAPEEILDRCLKCHERSLARANIRTSQHTLRNVVCTNCHSIHKIPVSKNLLAARQSEVCFGCHADVRAQFSMPSKHRVNEGFISCTDCHNPHGSPAPAWRMGARPRLAGLAVANEEPCLACHAEKRGPFVFEHEAVRAEGCESCHHPHGSVNSRLLRRPVVFTLCMECHNGAGEFGGRAGGVQPQSGIHNMAEARYRNCTNCHVRIHGSNSSPYFFR